MHGDLAKRIAQLEARLAALEQQAGFRPRAQADGDLETAFGLTWLNRAGAGLVIAGLALGAAWANERGYLAPVERNALLALASTIVLGIGVRMLRSGDTWRGRFALGVAAVGASGLYLAPLTASRIDAVLDPAQAVAVGVALTLFLTASATVLAIPALATLGLLGALTIPIAADGLLSACGALLMAAALYVLAATRARPLNLADHAAIALATAGAVAVSIDVGSAAGPAVVGTLLLLGSAITRIARGDRLATELLFVLAAVVLGIAWTLGAYDLSAGAPHAWVIVSTALVLYGLLLLGAGVATGSRPARLLGVGTLVLAALKLVGHDLWRYDLGLRVAALFVLGLGLLIGSFLYSRYAAR